MTLWSWCGPEPNESVVRKNRDGYIVRDNDDNPIPAQLKDLLSLLELAPGMKGHVSRTAQRMVEQDLLRFEGKVMYLVFKPFTFDPKKSEKTVAVHGNWNIAGVAVYGNWLPMDPVARHDVIQFIEGLHAQWKAERNQANARARELLRTGLLERGISIERSSRSLGVKRDEGTSSSSSGSVQYNPTTTPVPPPPEPNPQPQPTGLGLPLDAEIDQVLFCLSQFAHPDRAASRNMLEKCRKLAPDATAVEICTFIRAKGEQALHGRNPLGVMLTSVPACFEGDWRLLLTLPPPQAKPLNPGLQRELQKHEAVKKASRMFTNRGAGTS
jgi:hypothetical protein